MISIKNVSNTLKLDFTQKKKKKTAYLKNKSEY
jgi:hypothetical protein